MRFVKKLGSLKLTFFLLVSLAAVSCLGTFIIQGENEAFYLKFYGNYWGEILLLLGVHDFYNTFFYRLLLFFLGLNLLVCTLNSFKFAHLKNRKKFALFLLHCGVLLIFAGAIIGKFTKYSESHHLLPADKVVLPGTNTELVFNNFSINFYPGTDHPKDYYSQVTVFEAGKLKKETTLRVNHPLKVKGFSIYQSSFRMQPDIDFVLTHRGKIIAAGSLKQGQFFEIPSQDNLRLKIVQFLTDVAIDRDGRIVSKSYRLKNMALLIAIYKTDKVVYKQWIFDDDRLNEIHNPESAIFDISIKRMDVSYSTIFQVVNDPGLIFVWIGFLSLFLGMLLSMFKKY